MAAPHSSPSVVSALLLFLFMTPLCAAFVTTPAMHRLRVGVSPAPGGVVKTQMVLSNQDAACSRRDLLSLAGGAALLLSPLSFAAPALAKGEGAPGTWAFRPKGSTFDEAEVTEGFTVLENGLKYKDVTAGSGKEIAEGTGVRMNFAGYVLETGKEFDNSWDKGRLLGFKVGSKAAIAGLEEGIKGMKFGGRRILVIPSSLAYKGKRVYGGLIPADSTLVVYVQAMEEGGFFGFLESPNAWLVGSLPEEKPKKIKKEIECFNPKGCF